MDAIGDVKPEDIETNSFTNTTYDYYVQSEDQIPGDFKYALVNYAKPTDLGAFIQENKELWKPLLVGALVVLLIEWYIYNRRVYI